MKGQTRSVDLHEAGSWVGWCCSYCAAPLQAYGHGLRCQAEDRWFATQGGVHRLLPDDRRRELRPFLELYQRVRRDEGWRLEAGLPEVADDHPQARVWRMRALHFRRGLEQARVLLGAGPWRVLEVGAGSCWASLRLLDDGHRVAALDVNLDPDDGLFAANALLSSPERLPRAEAEMDALPLEPASFDLVLAAGSLHYAPRLTRTLVELRRVTRRGGVLLVLDSPVYRRRHDGEAMVAARMKEHARHYGVSIPRESQSSYLVLDELEELFRSAGWRLRLLDWPVSWREAARDLVEIGRHGRRTARFPVVVGRRDG